MHVFLNDLIILSENIFELYPYIWLTCIPVGLQLQTAGCDSQITPLILN